MQPDDYDEYEKAIVQRIRKAFMIPDEMELTPDDIRRIRKSTLIDYWSTSRPGNRKGVDLLMPGSYSRWEAKTSTYKKLYSVTPWFTGEFTKEQKENMGCPMEQSARGMLKSFVYLDEEAGFYAEDVNSHRKIVAATPQSEDTVLMTGGRRTGLTYAALEYAKARTNQADMVTMETDRDTGLSEMKVITQMKVITYKEAAGDMMDYIDAWKNPLDNHPHKGMKNKAYPSQLKRVAKRKAQKLARRINRNK